MPVKNPAIFVLLVLLGPGRCEVAQVAAEGQPASGVREALVIIAPEIFHDDLRDYVRHKSQQRPTRLIGLRSALSGAGVDDPEKLKRFVFQQWRDRKAGYVLLVGDADQVPVRYMVLDRKTRAAFDYAFYPSDLYYSDLVNDRGEFDDWNARRDSFHAGYFGEVRGEKNKDDPINYDQIDYRPDIAVGRWPVSTPQQVRTVAAKTIAYEAGIVNGAKRGMRRVAAFCVDGWVDSRAVMDRVIGRMPKSWSVEKRYYSDGRRDDQTEPPDSEQLEQLLNAGLGLVFHAGHGSDFAWHKCFSLKNLKQLRNSDRLPIMISAGCSTARMAALPPYDAYIDIHGNEHPGTDRGEVFSAPPPPPSPYQVGQYNLSGLGEQLLGSGLDGAVAYIGCNTGSQPCGLTLLEGFSRALGGREKRCLGDCWSEAVRYYYHKQRLAKLKPTPSWYPPSVFFQGMKFMLFGDPSLLLPPAG